MDRNLSPLTDLPDWIPDAVRLYLDHIEQGLSLRALARREGVHASTVLRTVRRYESRRDDPVLDQALGHLAHRLHAFDTTPAKEVENPMSAHIPPKGFQPDDALVLREGRRILGRLIESGAVLAIAPEMEKAAVLRALPDGKSARTAVVERTVAQAFLLKDWIQCRKPGRIATYEISAAGRAALKRMIGEATHPGMAEAATPFAGQHRDWDHRQIQGEEGPRRVRYNVAESPVAVLGRRREKDGRPFLAAELVEAAERLREDFELAQMGPRVAQNWERFLTVGGDRGTFRNDAGLAEGPARARDRVAAALRDLGPGLGDVALRVCCFLEGVEAAETRLGWAARSGKIVLRIALQRLRRHYDETYGRSGPLIG